MNFLTKNLFQVLLEKFLEQILERPGYQKCWSNIVLSNGKKIRVVRHIDRKIFQENQKQKTSDQKKRFPGHHYRLKIRRHHDDQMLPNFFFSINDKIFSTVDELWYQTRYLKYVFCFILLRREKIISIEAFNQNIFKIFQGGG